MLALHVEIGQPSSSVLHSINRNIDVAVPGYGASSHASPMSSRGYLPREDAREGVIVQDGSEVVSGEMLYGDTHFSSPQTVAPSLLCVVTFLTCGWKGQYRGT